MKYLYEARDDAGNTIAGYVDAAGTMAARDELVARGLREVVVLDDELSAELRACAERDGVAADRDGVAADRDIDLMSRFKPSVWGLAIIAIRRNALWVAGAVIAAAVLAYVGWYLFALGAFAIAAAIPLFPAWIQWLQNEMYRAFWRGDYATSERMARRLRRMRMYAHVDSILMELDSRIAAARVKQGDVEGAFALMAPWKESASIPPVMHSIKESGLHFLARDWRRYLEAMEATREASGDAFWARIDVAQSLARIGDDDERARSLLEGIDAAGLSPLHVAFIGWGRGVLALSARRDDEALRELAHAVNEMQKMGENPVTWGSLALATGYLCVAMARRGLRERAAAMLASVRPIVETHAEDRLLHWLQEERLVT